MKSADPISVIAVHRVNKSLGDTHIIRDLTFEVKEGEIFGFLGPNGAGKTTTIRLLLDVLRPDSGDVILFGDKSLLPHQAHAMLGYLSGDMVLESGLTGRQYLTYIGRLYGKWDPTRMIELAEALDASLDVNLGSYSRGNRQKIGLIAALMHNPRLLILDEPSSGFDPLVQETFKRLIREYKDSGGTVFMSSHIMSEVQELCDRVAFIRDGSVVVTKTLDELGESAVRIIKVGGIQIAEVRTLKLPGLSLMEALPHRSTFRYTGDINALIRLFAKHHISDLTIREPELEEVFMEYYKTEVEQA